ncbi:unnamed protein product [Thelazia callipaeda]|uniref:LEM domain-containing protein n=1 Tax=Thelazia callipaeda TaxID=103827 RepID=A0A0N5CK85_THECL|nr:unnamed protein product [Thelazia callipaeda]
MLVERRPGPSNSGYGSGSGPLYENFRRTESASNVVRSVPKHSKRSRSAILSSRPKLIRNSEDFSIAFNNMHKDIIRTKAPIDMRPLSIPPPEIKRNSRAESYCYAVLGIATIIVFGIAFTIWLTYDSLEKFVSDFFN